MTGFKVAIIGTGQLAGLLARRTPGTCRKVIIGRQKGRAALLADEVGGLASDQISAVRGCQVIFLAVPGAAMPTLIQVAAPHMEDGAFFVNMDPETETEPLAAVFPRLRVAAAKLVGDLREIMGGATGVLLLDHVSGQDEERLAWLLGAIGTVLKGHENQVAVVNETAAEVLKRAAEEIYERLTKLGLEQQVTLAAVAALGPGLLREAAERLRALSPTAT